MKPLKLHLLALLLLAASTIKGQSLPVRDADGLGGLQ